MAEDTSSGTDLLALFEAASDTFDDKLHQVPAAAWDNSTPCQLWDVRAVVNHVVGEHRWVAPLMAGQTIADVGTALDGDLLGDDPLAAWHHATGPSHDAFAQPSAMGTTVHLSYGDERASAYCEQLVFDNLVHAWDLARGAGVDDTLPPDLVEWGIGWVTPILPMLTGSGAFGEPQDVPADADAQTRLLAMVGRRR
jgi:uncharacterized protein (TIGR03086 family)